MTGGGVSTFYFDEAHSGFVADVVAFFDTVKGIVPAGVQWTVASSGDLIDVATGDLSGTWTDVAAGPVTATGAGIFALGVGARVKWLTSGIRNGRRVLGSTFVVPLLGSAFEGNGSITAAAMTAMNASVSNLLTASGTNMRIYSQPKNGLVGQANTVVGGNAVDTVSWLRSRRT